MQQRRQLLGGGRQRQFGPRHPWGSYAEYSFDIDFVPHDIDWPAADHAPEDSFYVWGPQPPADFVINHEHPAAG